MHGWNACDTGEVVDTRLERGDDGVECSFVSRDLSVDSRELLSQARVIFFTLREDGAPFDLEILELCMRFDLTAAQNHEFNEASKEVRGGTGERSAEVRQ